MLERFKYYLIILTLCFISFFFKFWFISLSPQPIIYDQTEYIDYAEKILKNKIAGRTSRTYGYPLYLAVNFLLFGRDNYQAIIVSQTIIDILTGLLLFLLVSKLFKSIIIGFLAFAIQLFNPFTTAYIGVVLTEVLAAFLISTSLLLFYILIESRKIRWAFFLGVTTGYLIQTRPSFYLWGFIIIFLVPYLTLREKIINFKSIYENRKYLFKSVVFISLGLFMVSFYQIYSNLKLYQQFSATTVDSFLAREHYDGALLKNPPLFPDKSEDYPIEMRIMYAEYSDVPKNAQERKEMANKYFRKAIDLIRIDPADYAITRVKKMWNMWQKQNVFFYKEPGFERHWPLTYILNLLILGSAVYGLLYGLINKDQKIKKFTIFTVSILLFMTFTLSLTHAEPRLTIPAYPLLFLFSAYGGYKLFSITFKNTSFTKHGKIFEDRILKP